ncbi:MAG TPA: glycosyltransferase family 1 protein, partial [Bacteroidetes bacterium]|nr:glycosyltransferase family 1 protein [Bacteroidota bacterium]
LHSAEGYFAVLDGDERARQVAGALSPEVRRTRRPPSAGRLDEVLRELDMEGAFADETLRRLPAYVTQEANRVYRREMLAAVADLRPVVYGEGWAGELPAGVELRGPADYYRDLPRIYRSDSVHLSLTNLQMRAYPNQRAFDVGASRGCLLNDRLEGWTELFGEAMEELVFDGAEQLHEAAERLLADPSARARQGEMLHGVVLARHTMAHRVERVLEVLRRAAARRWESGDPV